MKTITVSEKDIRHEWYLIDASDKVLGRFASKVAGLLAGKGKASYCPSHDHGDNVIVINAGKIKLTGKKAETKTYFRHSTKPGHAKHEPYRNVLSRDSRKIIIKAVHGMLPKTALGRRLIKKLYVYSVDQHPHSAQKPTQLAV